jgi:hypothetical protein
MFVSTNVTFEPLPAASLDFVEDAQGVGCWEDRILGSMSGTFFRYCKAVITSAKENKADLQHSHMKTLEMIPMLKRI